MSRRGENIYKRKDGRWEGRYVKCRDYSGKAKYGYVYGSSYREVKDKLCLYRQNPAAPKQKERRFAEYCDEWLLVSRSRVKESTHVKYYNILNRHIKPKLGGCFARDITTLSAEAFGHSLLEGGLSAKSVKDILVVLQSVLKYCRRQDSMLLHEIEIVFPKESRQEVRVLSLKEQKKLISFLSDDEDSVKAGILLALLTGMRIGEICALRWDNIDLEHGVISVSETMQRLQTLDNGGGQKTKICISSAKSNTSVRTIPLTDAAMSLCERIKPISPKAFILTGEEDRYLEPRMLQYKLSRYTKECGLEKVHFHTLRHTFATRCVEVGFEIKTLSEILGHSSAKITLDRYVHSSIEMKKANMQKLAAVGL